MDDDLGFIGLTVGMIVTSILLFFIFIAPLDNQVDELAQSICDKEYDMDYDRYHNKELKCKPREPVQVEAYDGITIQIKEVQ